MVASSRRSFCPKFNDCSTVVIEALTVPANIIFLHYQTVVLLHVLFT